jgi:hypothetical protein
MRSIILAGLLLFSYVAGASVGIGTVDGDKRGVTIGDLNLFRHDAYYFGLKRYGGGVGSWHLGSYGGLSTSSSSGVIFNEDEPGIVRYGLHFENRASLQSDIRLESFYLVSPQVAAGPQVDILGCNSYTMVRSGPTVGNLGKSGLLPNVHLAHGVSEAVQCGNFMVNGAFTFFGQHRMSSLDVAYRTIGARLEETIGFAQEKTFMILYRIGDK